MMQNEWKSIYKKCKRVTNTKSQAYKNYAQDVKNKFNALKLCLFLAVAIPMVLFTSSNDIVPSSEKPYCALWIFLLLSSIILYKWKHNSFFIKETPNCKKMAFNSDLTRNMLSYKQVSDQLNKNKSAVRMVFKTFKNFFIIFVIGLFEDDIKTFLVTSFQLISIWRRAVFFYLLILLLALLLLPLSTVFYNILLLIIFPYSKLKQLINICIDNGLFVKNYTLLYCTKKILEENIESSSFSKKKKSNSD